jgi:O-antigen ligase
MKLARALSDVEARKVQTFVLLGGVFTTLTIWTKLEDPINLPKMFVLVLFAAIALGLVIPALLSARKLSSRNQKLGLGLMGLFAVGLLVSTLATDVKYTAIFGEFHRNNGFLSYFAMIVLMVAGSLVFNLKSVNRYFTFFGIAGLLLTFYGALQGLGADPVGWKIDYNPFITTLGNPNFTSGFLGLSGIAILYLALDAKDRKFQVIYAVGLLADLYILWRSGSIQGVFGFLIGATIIILVKLWLINKRYGQIGLAAAAIAGAPVALAVLNIGPLASKLYQGTLRNRFDYWNAAIGMFKDHPIFGVGIDRFGEYYREYAVQNQVVQGQITDNAHSIYLQLLATGGLALFIPYLLLVLFITFIGFKALLKRQGDDKFKVGTIFGIWLATIAVNIVTVDNLGVGVWFWITGGVLVAVSANQVQGNDAAQGQKERVNKGKSTKSVKSKSAFPFTYLASFILVISVLVLLVPVLGKSSTLYNFKVNASSYTTQTYIPALVSESKSASNDPQYLIQLANLAFTQNAANEAFVMIDQINKIDSRSYYGNYFAAYAFEALDKRSDAIKYRERLKELDPWNNASLIELIKNYLSVGDKASAAEIGALIKRNYPGSQSDIDASALLVG